MATFTGWGYVYGQCPKHHNIRRPNSSTAPKLGCGCAKYRRTKRNEARKSRKANR